MRINFIGMHGHEGTLYKSGYVRCSCGKILDKVSSIQDAYVILERHIRIKTNHMGSLVKDNNEGK